MNSSKIVKTVLRFSGFLFFFTLMFKTSDAQFLLNSDSAFKAGAPNSGRLWGYSFGDYYFKAHTDTLNRGGSNQYSGVPKTEVRSLSGVYTWDMTIISVRNSLLNYYWLLKTTPCWVMVRHQEIFCRTAN